MEPDLPKHHWCSSPFACCHEVFTSSQHLEHISSSSSAHQAWTLTLASQRSITLSSFTRYKHCSAHPNLSHFQVEEDAFVTTLRTTYTASMLPQVFISILALPLLISGHFHVVYPEGRNPNEDDTEPNSPCGGYKQSSNRTQVSFPSFPVALELEHDRSVIQMNLALGDDPTAGANFNIALERSFQQQGEGTFCLPDVIIPSDVNITNGQNATLQVITDGEAGGGLYVVSLVTSSQVCLLTIGSVPTSPSLRQRCLCPRYARTQQESPLCH